MEANSDADDISQLEETIAASQASIRLMENEESELRELIAAAEEVTDETKINKILTVLDTTFAGRAVLFFTEYKATQSLLMSALIRKYGDSTVAFINGDGESGECHWLRWCGQGNPRRQRVRRQEI